MAKSVWGLIMEVWGLGWWKIKPLGTKPTSPGKRTTESNNKKRLDSKP